MNENRIELSGVVSGSWEFDYSSHGEDFYKTILYVCRSSGNVDEVCIVASEYLINPDEDLTDSYIALCGSIKTYNVRAGENRHLKIFVDVDVINVLDVNIGDTIDINEVEIDGFICKMGDVRTTPLHKKICDVILANNTSYGKSSYIPCIFWGKNADSVSKLDIGSHIKIKGRMQSRIYKEENIAYELSVQTYEEL